MDPIAVLKTVWRHKWFVLPVVLATLAAAVYVFQFGPRAYESHSSIAMVNPALPTEAELEKDSALAKLNSDNPFLRSADPTLITDALITRMNSAQTAERLESTGFGVDYTVAEGATGNGFVVDITGSGETPEAATALTAEVERLLAEELRQMQKVNGADDMYLYTPLTINSAEKASEQFTSRLRSVIMVFLGGAVLLFGAVSAGRAFESRRIAMATSGNARRQSHKRRRARTDNQWPRGRTEEATAAPAEESLQGQGIITMERADSVR